MTDGHQTLPPDAATPPLESLAERLRSLESQLAALQSRGTPPGPLPAGYAAPSAPPSATGGVLGAAAGLLPALAAAGGFWSRFNFLRELRLAVGMYVDSRYRVSRVTQLAAPGLLALMVANYFFFNGLMISIFLVTPILERAVLIVLAVALYQVLSREAARYGEVLAYLNRYGH